MGLRFPLKGNKKRHEQGEWTRSLESSVDCAICNTEAWDVTEKFRVGESTESDHMPLELALQARVEKEIEQEIEKEEEREIQDWSEEEGAFYKKNLRKRKAEKKEIQEEWNELVKEIRKAVCKKVIQIKKPKIGKRKLDKKCRKRRKRLSRMLKQIKRKKIERRKYTEERQKHNMLCEKKQKKEKEQKNIMKITKETEMWRYIKKERGRREKPDNSIGEEQWKRHFMELLEGRDTRKENTTTKKNQKELSERRTEKSTDDITEEEVDRVIARLKKKKAAGEDGIRNETWLHADEKTKEKLRKIMQKIWQGGEIPSGWKEGRIYPIHKTGSKKKVGNYRGITLLDTAYKIYAKILEGRLREEVNRLKILPETQAGFRKGRGCIDHIYALKTAVEKMLTKKKGKLYVLFADVKAAFDKVDRGRLWKNMKEYGINERLVERIKDIYKETISRVILGNNKVTERFWTERGLRQGCPLSPLLFIIYLADVEEFLKKRQVGGTVIGRMKIYTLAYADDLAMLAESENNMKKMLKSLEKYFEGKGLTLNADKSKILVFCKKERRNQERKWKWKNEELEEVRKFKYLGFTFKKNNEDDAHIKDVVKRAAAVMAQICRIGEKKFGRDFDRSLMIFNIMVKSIVLYGVEVWGWREWEDVEALQEKYVRWNLGLDRWTPGYVVKEKTNIEKISLEAGRRVLRYQDKIKKVSENAILKECAREMNEMEWESTNWGKTMKEFYEAGRTSGWEREAKEDKEANTVQKNGRESTKKSRRKKGKVENNFNERLGRCKVAGRAKYLGQKGKRKPIKNSGQIQRCCKKGNLQPHSA